jgi:competence protein ComEA
MEKKSGGKVAPASPVDINNASAAELEKVPGIGQATAEKIIAGRPYRSVEDLSRAA